MSCATTLSCQKSHEAWLKLQGTYIIHEYQIEVENVNSRTFLSRTFVSFCPNPYYQQREGLCGLMDSLWPIYGCLAGM